MNRIQNIRKERDYNITDRIALTFSPDGDSRDAIEDFADYISRQVLAGSLVFAPLGEGEEGVETLSLDDVNVKVKIVLL